MRFSPRLLLFVLGLAPLGRAETTHLSVDYSLSRIEIAVKATMDSFVGKLAIYEPDIVVNDQGEIVSARLTFHFRDVFTGKQGRDKAMHTWQHTDDFPDGTFVFTRSEPNHEGLANAEGQLTIHGVTRSVRFPLAIARQGTRYVIDGDVPVDTREFSLPIIRLMGLLKVDPIVHVRAHLQATGKEALP